MPVRALRLATMASNERVSVLLEKQKCPSGHCDAVTQTGGSNLKACWKNKNARQGIATCIHDTIPPLFSGWKNKNARQGIATMSRLSGGRCGYACWKNKNARQGIATLYACLRSAHKHNVGKTKMPVRALRLYYSNQKDRISQTLEKQKCPSGHCDLQDHEGRNGNAKSWKNKNARQGIAT